MKKNKQLTIVVPLAGKGNSFIKSGYSFPKPLIDVGGRPMIEAVLRNLKTTHKHKFIFICLKEQFKKYSFFEIFSQTVGNNFDVIQLTSSPEGAACSVLTAIDHIDNENELIIANSDQIIDVPLDDFVISARDTHADGVIMTFESIHPRWSYVRINKAGDVIETAEKKVISNNATTGIYYFKKGRSFVKASFKMIEKDIRTNNEFYVCPVYNELILSGNKIKNWHIQTSLMHGLGTPEELNQYLLSLEQNKK